MPNVEDDLAKKFWDLGNYVTGFASAHMLVFLFAINTQHRFLELAKSKWELISTLIFLFNIVVYVGSVVYCYRAEQALRSAANHPEIVHSYSKEAALYRTLWIVALTVLAIVSIKIY